MPEPVRIVPQWKELKVQLRAKLEAQKGSPEGTEGILLSDRPSILFRESCHPSLMPLICFYSSGSLDYFAAFAWRGAAKGSNSKVRLWTYGVEGEAPRGAERLPHGRRPKVLLITHVPSRNLCVAYCNDIHLRVYGDHTQDFRLLSDESSPCSITSMCYNPEMSELVTGAIGMLAFWSFGAEGEASLSITQTVSISSGEFVHFLCVEKERHVLVALCENIILSCLYAGDLAGDVKVWNFDTGLQTNQFKAHLSAIVSVVSRVSVHTLVTASLDGLLKEWNLSTCEPPPAEAHKDPVRAGEGSHFGGHGGRGHPLPLPVTGEILFVTWPFQLVEKAMDYVYDPEQEELLVTMGTADIYVLDTTKNPCPCNRLDLGGRTFSFIFSGYKSGRVRSVTQHLYRMGSRRIHDGNVVALSSISSSGNLSYHSRESSFLCSYGSDEYIILSDVILKKSTFLEVEPLASLVPGRKNPFWKETGTMHSSSITSFDYCHALSMLVTGGSDGSVRLWDILGQMLVEFDTSLRFSRVCFANQRGDLVVGGNKNIYFISCLTYLPSGHLGKLAARQMRDDVIERPLPFLPHFLLRFDIVFVPKYYQVGKNAKKYERLEPITNHKEVVMEKSLVTVVALAGLDASALPQPDFYGIPPAVKELGPAFAMKYQLLPQPTLRKAPEKRPASMELPRLQPHRGLPPLRESVPLVHWLPFGTGRSWPIAPDGYVPNSVIRAQLFPKGTPAAFQCDVRMTRRPLPRRTVVKVPLDDSWKADYAPPEKVRKKKAQRKRRALGMPEGQRRRDLLADIVSKPWLRHKPSEITLSSVVRAILDLMDDVPFSTYLMCTAALVQIAESYTLPPRDPGAGL
ncbi:UNVERIFIED_CONTAM: hypothetical protein K2H54_037788 [Gekko kuhli]